MSENKFETDDGRTHIKSYLMKESLVNRQTIAKTASQDEFAILPHVVMVSVGGQSIFDRGKSAIQPLVDEIAKAKQSQIPMVVGVGGGTRTRHTVSIALDLGIPLGGVAQLVGAMEEANAVFLNALLAKHGSIVMQREHFWELPLYLKGGMLPIIISVPPFHFWEPPPEEGIVPSHGSDFGLFAHAEVLGMKKVIFIKDEDGLYTADPKKHSNAEFIPHIYLDELLDQFPEECILDHQLFHTWKTSRHVEQVQIVNGLKPGMFTAALQGEPVGTIIERRPA